MEKRPLCSAAACDYVPPREENQSTNYSMQLTMGLTSETEWSEMTDSEKANGENLPWLQSGVQQGLPK